MEKSKTKMIWGIILIIVAIIYLGNGIGIWDFNLFFQGWWTLLIIIPCIVGIFTGNGIIPNLFGIIIGIILLLAMQDYIDWNDISKIIIPLIILWVGISLIFNKTHKDKKFVKGESLQLTAVFSGQEAKIKNENFTKGELTAVFGGVELDLTKAEIKEDILITATAVFGGIEIKVPDNVNVVPKGINILGGTDVKKDNSNNKKNPTIYINTTCIFGGIDIK